MNFISFIVINHIIFLLNYFNLINHILFQMNYFILILILILFAPNLYIKLKFVYPYGATINVRKPSYAFLSSGPISFPANRPVGAFYMSLKRGKLVIIASM